MSLKKNKLFFLSIIILSSVSLLSAIFIEIVINIKPCKLCLYQRIPYLFAIFVSILGIIFNKNLAWVYIIFLIFIISAIISGFHVGFENGIFEELQSCKNDLNILNKQDLLKSLKNQNISCKDVPIKILGMSLATINLMISLTVSSVAITFAKYAKHR